MPARLRINALLVFVLAILFAIFFDFTKHNPYIAPINPFAEDPYDAIGSFAIQAAFVLAILSLWRAFRPTGKLQPSGERKLFLFRTQIAAVLCVLVTLAGDLIAMIRHISLLSAARAGIMLLLLVIGFFLIAAFAGNLVLRSRKEVSVLPSSNSWRKPALVSLLLFLVLFFYPEIQRSIAGALFTVVLGAVLLFLPVWVWGEFLSPAIDPEIKTVLPIWTWGVIVLTAILLGFTIVLRELTAEGATIDFAGSLFVISIYIGLEVAGIVIGYAFLGKYLGFFQSQR